MTHPWNTYLRSVISAALAPLEWEFNSPCPSYLLPPEPVEYLLLSNPQFQTSRTFLREDGTSFTCTGVLLSPITRHRPLEVFDTFVAAVVAAADAGDPHLQAIPALPAYSVDRQTFDREKSATTASYCAVSEAVQSVLASRLFTSGDSQPVHLFAFYGIEVDTVNSAELDMAIAVGNRTSGNTVLSLAEARNLALLGDLVFDTLDDYGRRGGEVIAYIDDENLVNFQFSQPPDDDQELRRLQFGFRGLLQVAAYALSTETSYPTLTNWSRYICVNIRNDGGYSPQSVGWTPSAGRRQDGTPVASEDGQALGVMDGTPSHHVHLMAAAFHKLQRLRGIVH